MNNKTEKDLMYMPYIEGTFYEGKGEYLGISKGCYKFAKHNKPFYQRSQNGPKYYFEKL